MVSNIMALRLQDCSVKPFGLTVALGMLGAPEKILHSYFLANMLEEAYGKLFAAT